MDYQQVLVIPMGQLISNEVHVSFVAAELVGPLATTLASIGRSNDPGLSVEAGYCCRTIEPRPTDERQDRNGARLREGGCTSTKPFGYLLPPLVDLGGQIVAFREHRPTVRADLPRGSVAPPR